MSFSAEDIAANKDRPSFYLHAAYVSTRVDAY